MIVRYAIMIVAAVAVVWAYWRYARAIIGSSLPGRVSPPGPPPLSPFERSVARGVEAGMRRAMEDREHDLPTLEGRVR